jgi:nitrogen-specific signal transduction histidine kinase
MKSATPNVVRDLLDEIDRLRAIVDRLLKEIEFATHKLTCVSIERECKCVPEIVRVCDHQAIGILQEAAEKARTT